MEEGPVLYFRFFSFLQLLTVYLPIARLLLSDRPLVSLVIMAYQACSHQLVDADASVLASTPKYQQENLKRRENLITDIISNRQREGKLKR